MTIEEIRKGKPEGATHIWQNEYGVAYYCYCEKIKRWLHYDSHHDSWLSVMSSILDKIKPL